MEDNTTATLTYLNDEGDEVEFVRILTPAELSAVVMAMDEGVPVD